MNIMYFVGSLIGGIVLISLINFLLLIALHKIINNRLLHYSIVTIIVTLLVLLISPYTMGIEKGVLVYVPALIITLVFHWLRDVYRERRKRISKGTNTQTIENPDAKWKCPKCQNMNPNTTFECMTCHYRLV